MTTPITITLAIPHRSLSPNARPHWRTKANHRALQRHAANVATLAALNCEWPRYRTATVQVHWFGKTAQCLRMDQDNIIGSLKGAIDGIVDGGLLFDDHGLTWKPHVVAKDAANPRVELVVTPEAVAAPRASRCTRRKGRRNGNQGNHETGGVV